jgi:hypothetical protein
MAVLLLYGRSAGLPFVVMIEHKVAAKKASLVLIVSFQMTLATPLAFPYRRMFLRT